MGFGLPANSRRRPLPRTPSPHRVERKCVHRRRGFGLDLFAVITEVPVQVRLPNPDQSPNTYRAQAILAHAPEGGPADAEHLANRSQRVEDLSAAARIELWIVRHVLLCSVAVPIAEFFCYSIEDQACRKGLSPYLPMNQPLTSLNRGSKIIGNYADSCC